MFIEINNPSIYQSCDFLRWAIVIVVVWVDYHVEVAPKTEELNSFRMIVILIFSTLVWASPRIYDFVRGEGVESQELCLQT
jgi:hypothetical protein